MNKAIFTTGYVFLLFVLTTEMVWSQSVGRRVIKFPESWHVDLTLKISISVNGEAGDITVIETPPEGWIIGRTVPPASVVDGVITWNRTINKTGLTRTFLYDLTIPNSDTSPGSFHGLVNEQEILDVHTFNLSTINPGIQISVQTHLKYNYLIYLPPSYEQQTKPLPLLFYLHGGGQRGSDLNLIKFDGPPKIVEAPAALSSLFGSDEFPFVLVSPQTPSGLFWENPPLLDVLMEVLNHYNIDRTRIYVTGFSMGGFGTWSFASDHAGLIAAIVPIAGGRDPRALFRNFASVGLDLRETIPENLVDMPVWAFHGDRDPIVSIQMDRDIIEPLQSLGGNVKFTVYSGVGHDSWTQTYNNPEVYRWILSQKKQTVSSVPHWEIYQ